MGRIYRWCAALAEGRSYVSDGYAHAMGFEGGHVMMGVPKAPTPAYQKVFFYVDAKTFQVRRVLLLDAQRNRNRFDFVTPIVNKTVDKAEFNFNPPAGTRIIKP